MRYTLADGSEIQISRCDLPRVRRHYWQPHGNYFSWNPPRNGGPTKHQLLQRFIMGAPKGWEVDHRNGDKKNYMRSNLRIVTRQQNAWNSRTPKTNTSGRKGVSFYAPTGKWRAHIVLDQKFIHLGFTKSFRRACELRLAGEKKYHEGFYETKN